MVVARTQKVSRAERVGPPKIETKKSNALRRSKSRQATTTAKERKLAKYIGQTIKLRRQILGVSAAVLAKRVRVSANYIYQIESGRKTPTTFVLFEIANALGVKIVGQ